MGRRAYGAPPWRTRESEIPGESGRAWATAEARGGHGLRIPPERMLDIRTASSPERLLDIRTDPLLAVLDIRTDPLLAGRALAGLNGAGLNEASPTRTAALRGSSSLSRLRQSA